MGNNQLFIFLSFSFLFFYSRIAFSQLVIWGKCLPQKCLQQRCLQQRGKNSTTKVPRTEKGQALLQGPGKQWLQPQGRRPETFFNHRKAKQVASEQTGVAGGMSLFQTRDCRGRLVGLWQARSRGFLLITSLEGLPEYLPYNPTGICVGSLMGMGKRMGCAPQQPYLKGNIS